MTRNPVADNEAFSAVYWSAILNAHNLEVVLSGCTPSKGGGDWDVDVASGTAIVGRSNGEASVSSQTKTLTKPSNDADLDSGETRVDLISIDSGGTANVTEGSPGSGTSSDPVVAPDIPSGEVLVAAVTVDGGANSLTSSDINDYRVLFGPKGYPFNNADVGALGNFSNGDAFNGYPLQDGDLSTTAVADPVYGDGSDGSITRSANGNENGIINATSYTIQSGVTQTVSNGWVAIFATDKITIDGTLTADGQGGGGGSSGGAAGATADIAPEGTGGAGGAGGGSAQDGGAGGDGDTRSTLLRDIARADPPRALWDTVQSTTNAGAGGGAGGDGNEGASSNNAGSDGSSPGGGGGGAEYTETTGGFVGGEGGDGGGYIMLCAPTIEITGTVTADGEDGNTDGSPSRGGGGGGGGSGGAIVVATQSYTQNGSLSASKGLGGQGTDPDNTTAGDGADGAAGVIREINQ